MFLTKGYLIIAKCLLVRVLVIIGINIIGEAFFLTSASKAQIHVSSPSSSRQLNFIKKIEFIGNTVFSDSELENILASYKGQTVSLELLQKMGQEIDTYYLNKGYLTSGSFIPPQEFQDGIVQIQIIEGILDEIKIDGLNKLNQPYLEFRLPPISQPLNVKELYQSLERLRKDPLIKEINGKVTEAEVGKNILLLTVEENPRLNASITCSDTYSVNVGRFGCQIPITYNSAFLLGDRIILSSSQAEGLSSYKIGYSILLDRSNNQITFEYNTGNTKVVQENFKNLGIERNFESFAFDFTRLIFSTNSDSLTLGFGFKYIDSESFILNDFSFAFIQGLENGETKFTVLNFTQEYLKNWSSGLLTFKSQFNVGINAFDATTTELGIDGLFWSWNGNFKVFTALNKNQNAILAIAVNGQLTPDKLLPLYQITAGGQDTVRGFIRNLGIADNGINANIELQITMLQRKWGSLAIIPFVDVATFWNNYRETTGTNTFVSAGMAIRCRLGEAIEARIDYAEPLNKIEGFGETDIEDNLVFSVFLRPFKF